MRNFLIVGCGGFLGSALRYGVSGWAQRLVPSGLFPVGTLVVNVVGCFVLGLLGGYAENVGLFGPSTRLFLFLGVLGGFTTFSTFGYETMAMLRDGQSFGALANVGLQIVLGLAGVWLGYSIPSLK